MASYYKDVREHLKALEEHDKLFRIKKQINKDTQLMPLVRWQFRGLEEKKRKAFLFENVIDVKGKRYTMPVTVGTLAASTEIYALGLKCESEQIHERWTNAQMHPLAPTRVKGGPAQENVWQGEDLLNGHGLDMLPVPISTPGFDNAPYLTSANWALKIRKRARTTSATIEVRSKRRTETVGCFSVNTWARIGRSARPKASHSKRRSS